MAKLFCIDQTGKIAAVQSDSVSQGQTTFTTENDLASVTAGWPSARLLEIWNQLPGATAVRRFTDRQTAVARIWKAVETLDCTVAPQTSHQRAKKVPSARKLTQKADSPKANKTATVLELLRREGGATLEDIMNATGWQAHSVRGFISGVLGKRMGLTVESAKRDDGKRTYSIAK